MIPKIRFPKSPIERISRMFKKIYQRLTLTVDRRPFASFFALLFLLLALIVISSFLHTQKPATKEVKKAPKQIHVYRIGKAPRIRLQAQVEKSGVIQMTSLMGGVVQSILVKEGAHVTKGETMVSLSTNYQGGNAFAVQRQIAERQFENVKNTYEKQKDLLEKQRNLAEETDANADAMREITSQSIGETQNVINLNNDILSSLNSQLNQLTASNSANQNNQAILALKGQVNQIQAANLQLNSSVRNAQYQSSDSNPPAKLSDLQRQIALIQLDIQEKAIQLNKEITGLQLQLARINEALMYPAAPFAGTVQRVFVKEGVAVTPGTPLFVLSQDIEDDPIVAIAYAPREVAQSISQLEESTLHFGGISYSTYPSFVTQDAIQGTLYGIYFPLPDNYSRFVTDKGYIEVDIPVGYFDTNAVVPFIPIDTVYQTENSSYVFVKRNGKAVVRELTLGQVLGSFVQVDSGLQAGDEIITERTVVANDPVSSEN